MVRNQAHVANDDCLEHARKILRDEALAIQNTADLLDSSFHDAVQAILNRPNSARVVVSGMGKAGFIAMKISATLASIGVSSFFLHPAEALHGDLGRFEKDDLAIILSNSGETPEIVKMVGVIKRIGCRIIALTARANSSLSSHSDIVIALGTHQETGPGGVAPTTSTAVMLAIGDALAMTVWGERAFDERQFALYHPGGELGKKLMTVAEVMRTGTANPTVLETLSVRETIHTYTAAPGRPGAATIVNAAGKIVGVFTDGGLRRLIDDASTSPKQTDFLAVPIAQVMTPSPKTIAPTALIQEAARIISELKIDQLIVADEAHRPVGLLDIQDIVRVGY
jgi:arabinose-5-phosphate isomerase